jgi:hypothetical protein
MSCCKLRVANFGKICRVNSSMRSLGCEETGGNAQIAARPKSSSRARTRSCSPRQE